MFGIEDVVSLLRQATPKGHLQSRKVIVTDNPQTLVLGEWIDATLFFDGPSPVYVWDTLVPTNLETPFNSGESLVLNKHRRVKDELHLVCDKGNTSIVRIFYQ